MSTKRVTAEEVLEAAADKCLSDDRETLLQCLASEYASGFNRRLAIQEQQEILQGLFNTVVACLVEQLGGEARIGRSCIEDPPALEEDEDPVTGEWIYRTRMGQGQ